MPALVAGGLTFEAVSVSDQDCAVTTGGAAYCWGQNAAGELGDGTGMASATPVAVAGGLTWTSVSTGYFHTCGVTEGGVAYCWGDNGAGQLGTGTLGRLNYAPTRVAGQP